MTLIKDLIICSSILLFAGCSTTNYNNKYWSIPTKPNLKHVEIIPVSKANIEKNGYYLSYTNAIYLADNIDELKAYIQKLEVLSDTIIKHYGDEKLEK
jgi:hypothetical protein